MCITHDLLAKCAEQLLAGSQLACQLVSDFKTKLKEWIRAKEVCCNPLLKGL